MNWERIEKQLKQRRVKVVHYVGKLLNNDIAAIAEKQDRFVGTLQKKYANTKEEAMHHAKTFKKFVKKLSQ